MKHELSLSPEFIQASRSCQGDSARLRKFLQKLLRGEAVSVATIGGSVTGALSTPSCPSRALGYSLSRPSESCCRPVCARPGTSLIVNVSVHVEALL